MSQEPSVHPTAVVGDDVVLGPGTSVGPYAIIEPGVVVGAENVIHAHAFLGRFTTLGDRNHVHPYAVIGHLPQDISFDPQTETHTRIGNGNVFREHCTVHRATKVGEATVIGNNCFLMANTHVAHDCVLGDGVIMVNNSSVTGHCVVGDKVTMSGLTGIHQFGRIGRLAFISALSVTNRDLPPFFVFGGRPALADQVNAVGLRRAGIGREARGEIKAAFRLLYRSGLTLPEALARIEAESTTPEAQELVDWVRSSKRGISLASNVGGEDENSLDRKRQHAPRARQSLPEGDGD
jgi:UDP-N-acetylglucosamine acyltransferase